MHDLVCRRSASFQLGALSPLWRWRSPASWLTVSVRAMRHLATKQLYKNEAVELHTIAIITRFFRGLLYQYLRLNCATYRVLRLCQERRIAEAFVLLAAYTDDPKRIMATCVEEGKDWQSMVIKL